MQIGLQDRFGTAAEWTAANPVLAQGEHGLETDTRKGKTGNDVTAWNSLAYDKLPVADFATAAQGAKADTAVQPASTDTLTNKTLESLLNSINADRIHRKVFAGEAIAKGELVYVSGWNVANSCPEVKLAKANSTTTMPAVGMGSAAIGNGTVGEIYMVGIVTGLNTGAFTTGQIVYVSPTTAGAMTATRPTGPNIEQKAAVIGKSDATTGTLSLLMGATKEFSAADKMWYGGANGAVTEADLTAAGRALLDDPDAATQRTTLGAAATETPSASVNKSGAAVAPDFASARTLTWALTGNLTSFALAVNLPAQACEILITLAGFTLPSNPPSTAYKGTWNVTGTVVRIVIEQTYAGAQLWSADSLTVVP